jgi:hypothetical protein
MAGRNQRQRPGRGSGADPVWRMRANRRSRSSGDSGVSAVSSPSMSARLQASAAMKPETSACRSAGSAS